MLQESFSQSAYSNGIRCSSIQKSSCGYIKLSASLGGGIQGECVVMGEVWGDLPFFWSAGVVWTRTTRNRFGGQTSWGVDSGGFRCSLKMCGWMCGWIYLYISVFSPNPFQQVLFGLQLEEHPLRLKKKLVDKLPWKRYDFGNKIVSIRLPFLLY